MRKGLLIGLWVCLELRGHSCVAFLCSRAGQHESERWSGCWCGPLRVWRGMNQLSCQ